MPKAKLTVEKGVVSDTRKPRRKATLKDLPLKITATSLLEKIGMEKIIRIANVLTDAIDLKDFFISP